MGRAGDEEERARPVQLGKGAVVEEHEDISWRVFRREDGESGEGGRSPSTSRGRTTSKGASSSAEEGMTTAVGSTSSSGLEGSGTEDENVSEEHDGGYVPVETAWSTVSNRLLSDRKAKQVSIGDNAVYFGQVMERSNGSVLRHGSILSDMCL